MEANARILTNLSEVDEIVESILSEKTRDLRESADSIPRERLLRWTRGPLRRHILAELDCFIPEDPSALPEPWMAAAAARGAPVGTAKIGHEARAVISSAMDSALAKARMRPIDRLNARHVCERATATLIAAAACGKQGIPPASKCREAVFCRCDDGWIWSELLDSNAAAREGALMRHCAGSLWGDIAKRTTRLFSLRSPTGRPRLTVEMRDGRILQIRGRAQSLPKDRDAARIERFIRSCLAFSDPKAHECPDLLDAGFCWLPAERKLIWFPMEMGPVRIHSDLEVGSRSPFSKLPEFLCVRGTLTVGRGWAGAIPPRLVCERLEILAPAQIPLTARCRELVVRSDEAISVPADVAALFDFTEAPKAVLLPPCSLEGRAVRILRPHRDNVPSSKNLPRWLAVAK